MIDSVSEMRVAEQKQSQVGRHGRTQWRSREPRLGSLAGTGEGCVADPPHTITNILSGSTWTVLLFRIVMQDATSKALKL